MYFGFSQDQKAFRDAAAEMLANECPPEAVRAAWESETAFDSKRWSALAEMGVLGICAPESAGGLGMDELDLVGLLEETGRVALPEPVVETAAVGLPLLAEAGQDDRARSAADGSAVLAIDLGFDPYLNAADSADWFLVRSGDDLHIVTAADVTLVPAPQSVDGARRLFKAETTLDEDTLILAGATDLVDRAFERGALGTAAQLVGLARHMLDVTVEYAKTREQFGKPIGAQQAIKHHLADALLQVEFAAPLVYRGAYALATGADDVAVSVSMAKAHASDAAWHIARTSLQVHGAIGYSFEYDLHLWMKRAWALAKTWGDSHWHTARVGRAILQTDS